MASVSNCCTPAPTKEAFNDQKRSCISMHLLIERVFSRFSRISHLSSGSTCLPNRPRRPIGVLSLTDQISTTKLTFIMKDSKVVALAACASSHNLSAKSCKHFMSTKKHRVFSMMVCKHLSLLEKERDKRSYDKNKEHRSGRS